jgi:hypothetical protein
MAENDQMAEDRAFYERDMSDHIAGATLVDRGSSSEDEPKSAFALRLPGATIDALRRLAVSRGTTPSELVRGWIGERLVVEARQPSGTDPAIWDAATRAALDAVPRIAAETADRLASAS